MDGKKKIWATAVLCAVASVGFVVPAGAEETMTHDLDEVIVEADRNTLPGGFVANNDRVGILGNIKAIDVPFTQKKYTEKTIMTFYQPVFRPAFHAEVVKDQQRITIFASTMLKKNFSPFFPVTVKSCA